MAQRSGREGRITKKSKAKQVYIYGVSAMADVTRLLGPFNFNLNSPENMLRSNIQSPYHTRTNK